MDRTKFPDTDDEEINVTSYLIINLIQSPDDKSINLPSREEAPSKDVSHLYTEMNEIEDDENIKTQSVYNLPESKNQSNKEESCNVNDLIDLEQQSNSNLHNKDNDDEKTDEDNELYDNSSSNNVQLAQKLPISDLTDVDAPPTYSP